MKDIVRYFKLYPGRDPSDVEHYQNVINTKRFTMVNIAHLCRVHTEISFFGDILTLLESDIRSKSFYYMYNQDVTGKSILQVEYLFEVWVMDWSLLCAVKVPEWKMEFKWQAYDGYKWFDIGEKQTVQTHYTTGLMDIENPVEFIFTNSEKSNGRKYKYWRILGVSGLTEVNDYMNLLFMNVF